MRLPRRVVLVSALAYLVACSGGDSGGTGPTPKIATSLGISAGSNNQTAEVATAVPIAPGVLVQDQNGDPMSGVDVTFTVQTGGGSVTGATATSGANGVATVGSWTLGTAAGANTLRGSVTGLTPVTVTATGTAGTATALALTTAPSATVPSGGAFLQQPVIQVLDAYGNDRQQAGIPVTVAITSGGGTLNGTLTENTDAFGTATFTNLSIIGTVGPRTLSFTSAGLTSVASGAIDVQVGTPTTIVPTTSTILGGTVGQLVSNRPTVQVTDAAGNAVVGITVTFSVSSGGGSITGGSVATGLGGIAQVTSWTLGTVAGDNTLDATVGALAPVTFTATAQAGPAAKLGVITQPAGAQNAAVISPAPVVQLQDTYGNALTQSGVMVAAGVASGGGTLSGTLSVATDGSGQATFSNLSLTGTVGNRTLSFTSTGLAAATSNPFPLTAGSATTIAASSVTSQSDTVGAAVANPPGVLVTDASGNPVSGVSVTFALTLGGGSITGGSASSDANGIAALTSWTLGSTVGTNTVTATAAGLTGSPVTFTATGVAGPATTLVITTQPSGAVNGVALSTQPVLALRDGFGNPALQAGVAVTASIATGGGTLGGATTMATDANGVATFSDLSLVGTVGSRTLSFSATGLTGATSASFNLTTGAAKALSMVTQPSATATNGSVFAQPPRVRLVDAGGNVVKQAGVSVTVSRSPTTAALGGTLSINTNANGVAAFTNLSLTGAAGSYTLSFAATGLTSATSSSIALSAGPAANIVALSPLGQTTGVGTGVANPPSVQVTDVSGNPVSGVAVTFNVTAGGGTISPSNPMTSDATGIATLTSWTLGPSAGGNTVNASAALVAATVNFNATGTFQVASIAGGSGHTCALTVDGIAYCWGENSDGGLGDNSLIDRVIPTAVAGGHIFSKISAGHLYSCALTNAGAAWCWGNNPDGALGNGGTSLDSVPHAVSGGNSYQAIVTGTGSGRQTCAITTANAAYCWGADGSGQLGNGAPLAASTTPVAVLGGGAWSAIGAKSFFTCGVRRATGAALCWGNDGFGQLGNGAPKANTNQPVTVLGGLTFTQVAPSQVHTCGLVSGGAAYCWGANFNGRLGQDTATTTESLTPLAVTGGLTFSSLVSGEGFSCGRTAGGAVYCWGYNGSGQLGNGSTDNAITPTLVAGGLSFATIAAGTDHVCGVTNAGQAYCWGDNSLGQLGDGTVFQRETPTLVSQP